MRILKTLYFIFVLGFFAIAWWRLVPDKYMLWLLLSTIAIIVILHFVSYRLYRKVVQLNTNTDSIILVAGMLVLVLINFTVFNPL